MATRIEQYLAKKNGGNQSEMARFVGVTPQAVQKWIAGLAEPRGKNLEMAAQFLGVSPAELRFGTDSTDPVSLVPGAMRVVAVERDDPAFVQIPLVKLRLSAGIMGFSTEAEEYDGATMSLRKSWMDRNRYSPNKLIAIRVKGESMEPTLYDGDLVIINTADTTRVDGVVYAFNYDGEPVVKRLQREAGQWYLASDNSSPRFGKRLCHGDGCIIIGRVIKKESERI